MENNNSDKGSYRYTTLAERLVSHFKLRKFSKHGVHNVIKRTASFKLTEGAWLEMGDQCVIQDYAFFQLTKPNPRLVIGDRVVIGRHNVITVKSNMTIGDDTIIGSYVQIIDHSHGIEKGTTIRAQAAYFGDIRTLIPETSGQHVGIIRTAYRKHPDTLPG